MIKITYLEHSGFTVECDDYVLIFDYYKGNLPQFDKDKKNSVYLQVMCTTIILKKENIYVGRRI